MSSRAQSIGRPNQSEPNTASCSPWMRTSLTRSQSRRSLAAMSADERALNVDVVIVRELFVVLQGVQLKQQALAQIARANAGWFELLNVPKGFLKIFKLLGLF